VTTSDDIRRCVRRHPYLLVGGLGLVLALSWEIASCTGVINRLDWSSPRSILSALAHDLFQGSKEHADQNSARPLSWHLLLTLGRWCRGYALAAVIGSTLGFTLGIWGTWRAVGRPIVNVLRGLPSAAVWPLFALLAGFGTSSQLAVIVFGTLWPVAIDAMNSVKAVSGEITDSLQFMRLERWRQWLALARAALPGIYTGLEIGCGVCFLLSVTVEIFWPANGGLGWYLQHNGNNYRQDQVLAGVIITALVGWGLNELVHLARQRLLYWEDPEQAGRTSRRLEGARRILGAIRDERLRHILETPEVSETIEKEFGVTAVPHVLYQGQPYVQPKELSELETEQDTMDAQVIQRDITISAPARTGGPVRPILFARSWIRMDLLNDDSRREVTSRSRTIGHIIRAHEPVLDYRDLGYRRFTSRTIGALFGGGACIEVVQRNRLIAIHNRPAIFIQEHVVV
jgi:ABC-type nitrate/sulfonate/bicarbonate transport system permease component/chorismate-pyruvate lyase